MCRLGIEAGEMGITNYFVFTPKRKNRGFWSLVFSLLDWQLVLPDRVRFTASHILLKNETLVLAAGRCSMVS